MFKFNVFGPEVRRPTATEKPKPPSSPHGIELEVCNDIADRQVMGLAKYSMSVSDNPLDLKAWLQHAYEEALDQAIYLKRAIREIESRP